MVGVEIGVVVVVAAAAAAAAVVVGAAAAISSHSRRYIPKFLRPPSSFLSARSFGSCRGHQAMA